MAKNTWIKVNGTWSKCKAVWMNINGTWKKIIDKVNVNGTWKECIQYTMQKILSHIFLEKKESNRSYTFDIPNLISVDSATVNTGNIDYMINKNKVTINVRDGNYSSKKYNPKKHSKTATDSRSSSNNNFPSSVSYSKDDYSGDLYKNGNSYVSSGEYIPEKNKIINETHTYLSNPSKKIRYNTGGYSGDLDLKSTTTKILNGHWVKINEEYNGRTRDSSRDNVDYTTNPKIGDRYYSFYHTDGTHHSHKGQRSYVDYAEYVVTYEYQGTLQYIGNYSGRVFKSEEDTRVWKQKYIGNIYKSGYDYYYKYNVELKYTIKTI